MCSDSAARVKFIVSANFTKASTPPTEGAFDAIAELVQAFEGRVWLVSKCGPRIQQLTRRWLLRHDFHEKTGVRQDRVRFCLKRPEKRDHCEAIGATHFVDDRIDVLQHLVGVVPHLFLFGHQTPAAPAPAWVSPVLTWLDAREAILATRRAPASEIAEVRAS
jgi:hypothetical protein